MRLWLQDVDATATPKSDLKRVHVDRRGLYMDILRKVTLAVHGGHAAKCQLNIQRYGVELMMNTTSGQLAEFCKKAETADDDLQTVIATQGNE